MKSEFEGMDLHPQLVQAVSERGYTEPTPIQTAIIPLMLSGQDVTGQAQTGTGKTAAFALPMLHNLVPGQHGVKGLILAPTRELAMQVAKAIYDYGQHRGVRVLAVYGGQPYERQIRRLRKGVDIVVGTPGRLLDLIRQGALDLSAVDTVVLDEADEMLSMGFIEDIEAILIETPESRQTALFSATLPAPIRRLADRYMRDPQAVTIQRKQLTVAALEQRYYLLNHRDKLAALTRLFEVEDISSALIFVRTRVDSGDLASELSVRGFPAEALNGDLSQDAREQVLNRFRRHQSTVLVATDVAARGLDIDDISHVINYDLPQDPEVYVHRVGRTGRAGKTGIAITLLTPKERWQLRRIETLTRQKLTEAKLPTEDDIRTYRDAKLFEQLEMWLRRGRGQRERDMVHKLAEAGHDPFEIATAAMKLARAEEKQRPIAPISEIQQPRPRLERRGDRRNGKRDYQRETRQGGKYNGKRNGKPNGKSNGKPWDKQSHEQGMVRLVLSAGKLHGIRPNDVVGSIAGSADIPGYSIGAIRIHEEHTHVDIPEELVHQVLDKAGNYRIRRHQVTLERA
ncbi:MAG: DEAD/DEAH box helicase [Proteobacteria bacterium]|nr:DEAD/DEAH box helicase [Pseudomonadota bacterium]